MDRPLKIYKTRYKYEIEAVIKTIDALAINFWKARGYNFDHQNNLIGKKNGVDNPTATKTLHWDVPKKSITGEWFCFSLSNDERFSAGNQTLLSHLNQLGLKIEEIEKPKDWIEAEMKELLNE